MVRWYMVISPALSLFVAGVLLSQVSTMSACGVTPRTGWLAPIVLSVILVGLSVLAVIADVRKNRALRPKEPKK